MWNLVTSAGRIGIAFKPSGTEGFDELSKNAEKFSAYGVTFLLHRSMTSSSRRKQLADPRIETTL